MAQLLAAFMGVKAQPRATENRDAQAERLMAELSMFPQPSNQR